MMWSVMMIIMIAKTIDVWNAAIVIVTGALFLRSRYLHLYQVADVVAVVIHKMIIQTNNFFISIRIHRFAVMFSVKRNEKEKEKEETKVARKKFDRSRSIFSELLLKQPLVFLCPS